MSASATADFTRFLRTSLIASGKRRIRNVTRERPTTVSR
jgi:hypothetical protein